MLPDDPDIRREAFGLITEVMDARGEYSAEDRARMQHIALLFGSGDPLSKTRALSVASTNHKERPAKAS
ncbi:MAG: hypothetical protein WBG15_04050 [Xanthobacteraceae bacterium]